MNFSSKCSFSYRKLFSRSRNRKILYRKCNGKPSLENLPFFSLRENRKIFVFSLSTSIYPSIQLVKLNFLFFSDINTKIFTFPVKIRSLLYQHQNKTQGKIAILYHNFNEISYFVISAT